MGGLARTNLIDCRHCRHRTGVGFVDLPEAELEFMSDFKQRHAAAPARTTLIKQGQRTATVFTLYSGLAIRYRRVGRRRQVLKILLPGDLIGLQTLYSPSFAAIEAITDVTLCRFDPRRWDELLAMPGLAARICQVQALERRRTEARLCAVGTAEARANLCHFVADLYFGLKRRRLVSGPELGLPVSHQQLADALAVTPTHLRRIARQLDDEGVLQLRRRRALIRDPDRLAKLAALTDDWRTDLPLV
jgi:CRP-like cAMP-binding protein